MREKVREVKYKHEHIEIKGVREWERKWEKLYINMYL